MEDMGPKSWVMPRDSSFVYEALGYDHNTNNKVQDLICCSNFSYSNPHETQTYKKNNDNIAKDIPKFINGKKRKSTSGLSSSSSWKSSWMSSWSGSDDPEVQRKKRVAAYNAYAFEGKVKGSLKKSFAWLKNRYTKTAHGFW